MSESFSSFPSLTCTVQTSTGHIRGVITENPFDLCKRLVARTEKEAADELEDEEGTHLRVWLYKSEHRAVKAIVSVQVVKEDSVAKGANMWCSALELTAQLYDLCGVIVQIIVTDNHGINRVRFSESSPSLPSQLYLDPTRSFVSPVPVDSDVWSH